MPLAYLGGGNGWIALSMGLKNSYSGWNICIVDLFFFAYLFLGRLSPLPPLDWTSNTSLIYVPIMNYVWKR